MSIADKLAYLAGTKAAIRQAIEAQGVTVGDELPFRQYAGKIGDIEGGDGGADTGDIVQFQAVTTSGYVTSTGATAPAFATGEMQSGDLLVLTVMVRSEPSAVPTGFVEIVRSAVIDSFNQWVVLYSKVADGDETSFGVTTASSGRVCVSVAAYRGKTTPRIVGAQGGFFDTTGQDNYQVELGFVENPSKTESGLLCVTLSTALANSTEGLGERNDPLLGWAAAHPFEMGSQAHQNRMMINAKCVGAGDGAWAKTGRVAMSNADGGFSIITYLIAAGAMS